MGNIWGWDRIEGTFFEDKDDLTFCGLREGWREEDERDNSRVGEDNLQT